MQDSWLSVTESPDNTQLGKMTQVLAFYNQNINDPTAGSPTVTLLRLLLPPIVLVQ